MKVEPARLAVIHEASYVFFTGVAETRGLARWPGHELEGAFGVERVGKGSRREGTVMVQVIVTGDTLVTRAYPCFLTPITLEWKLCVFKG